MEAIRRDWVDADTFSVLMEFLDCDEALDILEESSIRYNGPLHPDKWNGSLDASAFCWSMEGIRYLLMLVSASEEVATG